jgi:uncharacterized protein YPO0396
MTDMNKRREELLKNYNKELNQSDVYDEPFMHIDKAYKAGFDAGVSDMQAQLAELKTRDAVRLWNENETLKAQLELARTGLNKISDACQCETDDRDICFEIAVKTLAQINQPNKSEIMPLLRLNY